MWPSMGSHQPANTSGGALPICLSGIGIHPRVQLSSRLHYHHQHNDVTTPMYSCRQKSIREQDVTSTEDATLNQRLDHISLNEVPLRLDIFHGRPRHALALQMADLDHRREKIRKCRSNRGLVNSMDDQRTFLERHSNRMQRVLHAMMQDPAFQYECVTDLQRDNCAKAA